MTGTARPRVLLASFCLAPEGEDGGDLLVEALARHGVEATWASWDDPDADWAGVDLVAVRTTWDYQRRLPAFRSWLAEVEASTPLLNGHDAFSWNFDKGYLDELGGSVPTVPGIAVGDDDLVAGLTAGLERWGTVVIKPRIGAGGVGVVVVRGIDDLSLVGLTAGPWLVQPLVESVRTRGESSLMVLGGRVVAQVDKLPAAGEVRVHGEHGGTSRAVPVEPGLADLALAAVGAAEAILGHRLDYARVDVMELDGRPVVSELELIEPGFYLDVVPEVAEAFASVVAAALAARP
ncbi:hypothetical protein [Nocardioides sp.]|uniref:ATP-grasp domain-containing protein n=1 Tax=Nocardioides sp. TaxID=35761 RepID=UPI002B26FB14|nr:hypothetical protein [Nocardioides sp.]